MYLNLAELQKVEFKERPLIISSEAKRERNDYDIVVEDPDDHAEYCLLLLEKMLSLLIKDYQEAFIDYQLRQIDDSRMWLQSLDKLMDLNAVFFFQQKREYLLHRFYRLVSYKLAHLKDALEEKENELIPNPYAIDKTKKYLEGVGNLFERKRFLHRIRTDYLQSRYKFQKENGIPFDQQIKLELSHLKLLLEFGRQPILNQAIGSDIQKLTVVGNIEVFTLAFKALFFHKGDYGKSYLKINHEGFIQFLSMSFQTEDGKPISKEVLTKYILDRRKTSLSNFKEIQYLEGIPKERLYDYDIDSVKQLVLGLSDYVERIIFLNRVRINYLQHFEIESKDEFHQQIKLEIKQQKFEYQFEQQRLVDRTPDFKKIKLNGRSNVLMTFFYELLEEFPRKHNIFLFENTKTDVIYFVRKYFLGKQGKELKLSSLRTILTPSKWDKRCTSDKKVDLNECLNLGTE